MSALNDLLAGIVSDPLEETRWLVLADWLEENDDPHRAELLRLHRRLISTNHAPSAHPERVLWRGRVWELLKAGVEPIVVHRELPLPGGLSMSFCWVPPGSAQLGSPKTEAERSDDEDESVHGVYRSGGFWLGTYPVTQGEWQAVTGENSSWFRAGGDGADSVEGLDTSRFPVECVGWDECQEFLKRLNVLGGREAVFGHVDELSLPHEDAWEFACRGGLGNESAYYWGNELNGTQANCDGNYPYGTDEKGAYLARPSVVGAYAVVSPHPWGLCDLHGNVCEWCENLYEQASSRVLRGGSWNVNALYCRAASRYRNAPDNRDDFVGFRVFAPGLY